MAVARTSDPAYEHVEELERMVLSKFPNARFKVTPMPDSDEGVAIWAYTDGDDDDLNAIVRDREMELLLEDDVYILTIPMPLEAWEN
jgi:hypothetical protein